MKKILSFLFALCLMAPVATVAAPAPDNAPLTKSERKAKEKRMKENKKEGKRKLKEFKKEGWKVFGSTRSLETVLINHYNKLDELGDDAREFVGVATNVRSKNVGKQMAMNSAAISYSSEYSDMRGRMMTDMTADGSMSENEFEHFYGAFEREVQKEIKGEMTESFTIIKDNGNGTYELQSFYIVSESASSKARIRSLQNALAESEAAQRHAERISAFVRGEK